eukprot:472607-Pyramimonas_sp.AAC.1
MNYNEIWTIGCVRKLSRSCNQCAVDSVVGAVVGDVLCDAKGSAIRYVSGNALGGTNVFVIRTVVRRALQAALIPAVGLAIRPFVARV